ncbi:GyrI-like domain-containing protein [Cohnella soli]|uniref:GyrI-like domain-containing protein n=1 Tax=Cohnella soli TaxID=425005 RepID=A0ABW0I120_9BACL
MEGKITNLSFYAIGYKHSGRFDQYHVLVANAFQDLKTKMNQIPSRTDTTVALYEPQRGPEHVEGFFYVGVIVNEMPEDLPEGSELLSIEGRYASAFGQIKNMASIYDFLGSWIEENGHKQVWPDTLFVERYEFPIPEKLTLEEEVEVLLPVEE